MKRTAEARWEGNLKEGNGHVSLGSGAFQGEYSFGTRFKDEPGTNPEELIGAAHAGCFSMALSAMLGEAGYTPRGIRTKATVTLKEADGGFRIVSIELDTEAAVPGIAEAEFMKIAENAKENCPVSKALAGTEIGLTAELNA